MITRKNIHSIVILTGAGISAESGLATFRDADGLWCNHRVEDVATPEAYLRDPALVQRFYNERRRQMKEAVPNAAHRALADLAERFEGKVTLVTQNVDDLHARALFGRTPGKGFELLPMHGELNKVRCAVTGHLHDWNADVTTDSLCACCLETETLRPHIVWFGEMPLYMAKIDRALSECDLFVSVGTSGNVYPAAGFVAEAKGAGAWTMELNLEPSLGSSRFDEAVYGPATQLVPEFVAGILSS
jgi:NAD-dependent deacetylase